MAKKKSRRNRGPRPQQTQQSSAAPAAPNQSAVVAPPARAVAPKAVVARPSANPSHNLGLELRMIAVLGGGAIAILAILSMVQPTTHVANWLHL